MSESEKGIPSSSCECSNNSQRIKSQEIEGDKYYINGKYWGDIIERNNNYFRVECNNDNIYMKGQVITINININNLKMTKI